MTTSRDFSAPCKPRFATPATDRKNLAAGIAKTAQLLGYDLMPWQDDTNSVATELTPAGRFAYRQVVIEVMRQQGKTVDLLPMMVARALRRPGTQISYTAQTRLDARHRLLDTWWPMIERSKLRQFIEVRKGSGSEAYLFSNGSMLGLVSGTQTSGHGDSLDLGVIDEAWAQRDDHIEQAMRPAMMTRDAQLWIVSAAGDEKSEYFRGKVEDGRVRAQMGVTENGCFISYSAADDEDPADPATWWRRMPALGRTVTEETVAADFELMDLPEFRRAYLCQWPEVAKPGWLVISEGAWDACASPGSPHPAGPVAIVADIAPEGGSASIAVAGALPDGRVVAEIPEGDHRDGTAWVVPRLLELKRKYRPCAIVIDKRSWTGSLIDEAENAGLEIVKPTSEEVGQAFGLFYVAVSDRAFVHLGAALQPALRDAVKGAARRDIGDGLQAWTRKNSAVDISPLCAVTLAVWAHNKYGRRSYNLLDSVR
jgi:phage terminase large subunit-like protein